MKIRVAFVDEDENYQNRLLSRFMSTYEDEVELHIYSDPTSAVRKLVDNKIKVLVVNARFKDDPALHAVTCPILFLSEDNLEGKLDGHPVTGKYQKTEEIYRQIVSLYSENAGELGGFIPNAAGAKRIITFASPAGGSGSSSMAVACAERLAMSGREVVYLNFENFAYNYYAGNEGGFEELLYTIKDNKTNIALKLESTMRKSASGVYYLPGLRNVQDFRSITGDDMMALITAFTRIATISHIVVDMDFSLDDSALAIFDISNDIIITTDGSETANDKVARAFEALQVAEGKYQIVNKVKVIYNRFSAGSFSGKLNGIGTELGTAPRYKASHRDIVTALRDLSMFNSLV